MQLRTIFDARVARVNRVFETAGADPQQVTFTSADLAKLDALEKLHSCFPKEQGGKFYLYTISIRETTTDLLDRTRKAFRDASATTRWNMSRDNYTHAASVTLYVGTSQSLFTRFRYHLGTGNGRSTYSLYLSAWATQLQAEFVVDYYEFPDTVSEDVELIEGVLWDELKPMFGKKGGRK